MKRVVFILIFALAIGLIVAAGLYFRPQLLQLAKDQVDRYLLNQEGLFIDYTLDTGGLDGEVSLRDIKLYRTAEKKEIIATLDELSVGIPLRALLLKAEIDARIKANGATLTVYEGAEQVAITQLSGTIDCLPSALVIKRFRGELLGVELQAEAHFKLAAAAGEETADDAQEQRVSTLDFSPIFDFAANFDYSKVKNWKPVIRASLDGALGGSSSESVVALDVRTQAFPSRDVELILTGRILTSPKPQGLTTIETLHLQHSSGTATLTGQMHPAEDRLEISTFASNLDWLAVAGDHPALAGGPGDACKVISPPLVEGKGSYHLEDANLTKLEFSFSKLAFEYRMEEAHTVAVSDVSAAGTLRAGLIRLTKLQAAMAGGHARGEVTYTPFEEVDKAVWTMNVQGRDLNLGSLLPSVDGQTLTGLTNVTFTGQGGQTPATLQGSGNISIAEGDFFQTKVFGPLMSFLHKVSNNPDKDTQDSLRGDFQVVNGVVEFENLLMDISEAAVTAQGTIDLNTEQVSIEARAKLRGPLGITVTLIGQGPIDHVEWGGKKKKFRDPEAMRKAIEAGEYRDLE